MLNFIHGREEDGNQNTSQCPVDLGLAAGTLGLEWSTARSTTEKTQDGILYVKPSASGDCSSWGKACELQDALEKASDGDEIWVSTGIYKPTVPIGRSATFQLKNGISLYGGFTGTEIDRDERNWMDNRTVLSGDIDGDGDLNLNAYHVVTASTLDETAILDGFIIEAGNADGGLPNNIGGGMFLDSGNPALANLVFSENYAKSGGGVYIDNGNPTLTGINFLGNKAEEGGGMYIVDNSTPIMNFVIFSNNSATNHGGGLFNGDANSSLTHVIFSSNNAQAGGGMFNTYGSSPKLVNVVLSGNNAAIGGGMANDGSSPSLRDSTFSDNNAQENGGGMYNYESNPTLTNVTFTNNNAQSTGGGMYNAFSSPDLTNITFSGNSAHLGGGMYNRTNLATLTNVTFFDNSAQSDGGGIYNRTSTPKLINTILWGNTPDQVYNDDSMPVITYSDIQGGYTGNGNIDDDPLLGELAFNGGSTLTHALKVGSPAIDAGSPNLCPMTDQRDMPRSVDGDLNGQARCDIGAFEFQTILRFLPSVIKTNYPPCCGR